MKKRLPWLLIYLRIFLTVFVVLFGYWGKTGPVYIVLMLVAAATDFYDGVLARKFKVETASLRQWDSIADTIFFMGVFAGMWLAFPAVIITYWWGISAIIGLEVVRYCYDFIKFRRGASYHAYSAKVFGVSLLVATLSIMVFGVAWPFLPISLIIGILSELEGLIMSVILVRWTYNIKHLGIAFTVRKKQLSESKMT